MKIYSQQHDISVEGEASCPDMLSFVQNTWLPTIQRLKQSWRVDERISRQHIIPFFGARKLSEITPGAIHEWLGDFESRNFAASTRNRILCVLKDIFKAAIDEGHVDPGNSPLRGIQSFPDNKEQSPRASASQIRDLMELLRGSARPEAKAISLLILTDATKNEILTSRWENFIPERGLLLVQTQSGKRRKIWLSQEALAVISSMERHSDCPWLFPGRARTKPISQIFPFWSNVRNECGLGSLRLQDLRYANYEFVRADPDPHMDNAPRRVPGFPERLPLKKRPEKGRLQPMPIAVIGMAMRFPGGVNTAAEMWETLANGKCQISHIPEERWPVGTLEHPSRSEPGRSVTFAAGVLKDVDKFDAGFFKISPREAAWMDPQQRLLLEMAHEAMEDAGIPHAELAGSSCGVYIGISGMDYGQRALEDLASMGAHSMTGNTLSIAANRISYFYDLRGPSIAMDTACSSSLAAVHHACQALRSGEAPVALAGGINLLMHPYSFIGFSHASMLSASGHCRPFDAAGDGYVRGEGGGLLLLKPLDRALADGDTIHAVILGTGVNADGARKTGLTIPSAKAQTELMRSVLDSCGLSGADVDFVEAHGTGTPVGDPVEAESIGLAYGQNRDEPVPMSSAKANFGHLEPASGMVGLIKAILVLKRRYLPPLPFEFTPNSHIDFDRLNVKCVADGRELRKSGNLICAVNSFGFGGLNAHVLLQSHEAPPVEPRGQSQAFPPLFLSAESDGALRAMAGTFAEVLKDAGSNAYYDVAWTCAFHRTEMCKRLAVWGDNEQDCIDALRAFASGGSSKKAVAENALPATGGVAFVYSGNGAQWHGMGRALYNESPAFAALLSSLDSRMRPVLGYSVEDALLHGSPEMLEDTAVGQPLLFVLQVAVTSLLAEMGIRPDAVAGHSVGEVAAAWSAGALSLEQAIQVIHARSLSQSKTRGAGGMAAVALPATRIESIVASLGLSGRLEIAAINSPGNSTISGDGEALAQIGEHIRNMNVFFKKLDLDYAFHSRSMDDARRDLEELLGGLNPVDGGEAIFVSTVTGAEAHGSELDAGYWWRNMREPVNFAAAIGKLSDLGMRVFVEIGPHAVLQRYIRENLNATGASNRILPTLQHVNPGLGRLRSAAAALHLLRGPHRAESLFPVKGRRVPLPFYPWRKHACWYQRTSEAMPQMRRQLPLLGWELAGVNPVWENILDPRKDDWLADHVVGGAVVLPAAAWIEIALEGARAWTGREAVAVENLDIRTPLVFENDSAQCVRCSVNPADGKLRIMARPRLGTGKWNEHVACRVIIPSETVRLPMARAESGPISIMEGDSLYTLAQTLGLEYGPFFRRVEKLSHSGSWVEADLREGGDGWIIDPGVMDSGFHSIAALYAAQDKKDAYLPVGAARVEYAGNGLVRRVRAFLRKSGSRMLHADFEFLDAAGCLVGRVLDCRFRNLPAPHAGVNTPRVWKFEQWLEPLVPESALPTDFSPAETSRAHTAPSSPDQILWREDVLPRLEAIAFAGMGEVFAKYAMDIPFESLPPYFQWMRSLLSREGLLEDNRLKLDADLPDWRDLWRETYRMAPHFLPALLPLARVLEKLPEVFQGALDGVELLASVRSGVVAHGGNWATPARLEAESAISAVVLDLAAQIRSGARLSILELGDSASCLLAELTRALPPDRLRYTLVVPDPICRKQMEKARNANFHVDMLLEEPAAWLDDQPQSSASGFDIIILRHTLHKSADLFSGLAKIHDMLKPGGLVVVAENHADWSGDLVDGLDPGWWRPVENGQPLSSRMPPEAWRDLFSRHGFSACESLQSSDSLRAGSFLLTARKLTDTPSRDEPQTTSSWVFLTDAGSSGLADRLAESLRGRGANVECRNDEWGADLAVDNVVILAGWQDGLADSPAILDKINRQALACADKEDSAPRFWIVTRGGALSCGVPDYAFNPTQGAIAGLGRVIANEIPVLAPVLIDISPDLDAADAVESITREFLNHPDCDDEVLFSLQGRHTPRILPDTLTDVNVEGRCRLEIPQPGRLDNLCWRPLGSFDLAPGEVEAKVMAVGLNFRDIMLTMGLLPEDALEKGFAGPSLGLEFSGVITRVGNGVRDFKPGDRVAGFAPACFASHVRAPARAIAAIPADMDFACAAASPTVFITAWYAIKHLAALARGESVLIHGGAGGVGLAALQIARMLGLTTHMTAGTPEKRDFLRLLGADYVYDSRNLDFADAIMENTGGAGVDAVLNSLAGEAMRRSLALLKPFGRFLELGKRDYVENTSIGLRPLKENISYFSIDVDQLLTARPQLAAELFSEVMAFLKNGEFIPPPHRIFDAPQIVDAFRTMQQARHIGKLVVNMEDVPSISSSGAPRVDVDFSGTWLVSGGLSGFGLETARHLAKNGVKNLVLASRRGLSTPGADTLAREFSAMDVNVEIAACDFSKKAEVESLVARICAHMPPLAGVVHAAAVFDDCFLKDLDLASLEKSLRPKLLGAWNLHEATLSIPLKHFILYSSISVALGNPGQANYVAANAGLESLANLRLGMGLPATCIAWGPIGDAGYLARNAVVGKSLAARLGCEAMTSAEAMGMFNSLAGAGGQKLLANVDWRAVSGIYASQPVRLSIVAASPPDGGGSGDTLKLKEKLADMNQEEASALLRQCVIDEAAKVLGLDASLVPLDRSLQSMGLDSLMAMELALGIERRVGCHLPPMLMQDAPNVDELVRRLARRLGAGVEEKPENDAILDELARRHSENLKPEEAREVLAAMEGIRK